MKASKYLNTMLTVNAALLAGVLWTQVASKPVFATNAEAQGVSGQSGGIPNAADQRGQMINLLREVKASVDATRSAVEGGKLRVAVTNLDEIKLSSDKK